MSLLNPATDKFKVAFLGLFDDKNVTEKYDKYLYTRNHPLKTIEEAITETIVGVNTPGVNLQTTTITGMPNVGSSRPATPSSTQMLVPANTSLAEMFESQVLTIQMRNNILNYLFFYEAFYANYLPENSDEYLFFTVVVDILDSAEIPMMRFKFGNCFITTMGGMELFTNNGFREAKTLDLGITFNTMDVEIIIPGFKTKTMSINFKKK